MPIPNREQRYPGAGRACWSRDADGAFHSGKTMNFLKSTGNSRQSQYFEGPRCEG